MGSGRRLTGKRVAVALAAVSAGGLLGFVAADVTHDPVVAEAPPALAIASRFVLDETPVPAADPAVVASVENRFQVPAALLSSGQLSGMELKQDTFAAAPPSGAPARAEFRPETTGKAAAPAEPKSAVPAPAEKRAAQPQPRPAPKPATLFNDAQIASIKTRLKLTTYQEQYWPAVESALKAIGQKMARGPASRDSRAAAARIDVNSPEVQQLTSAAVPLIMNLREDQKQEVRMLARVIGLDSVASRI
jgi:hypothetical protein